MSWGEEQKKEIETIRESMDTVGGVMYVEYKNGEVRECQK